MLLYFTLRYFCTGSSDVRCAGCCSNLGWVIFVLSLAPGSNWLVDLCAYEAQSVNALERQ